MRVLDKMIQVISKYKRYRYIMMYEKAYSSIDRKAFNVFLGSVLKMNLLSLVKKNSCFLLLEFEAYLLKDIS